MSLRLDRAVLKGVVEKFSSPVAQFFRFAGELIEKPAFPALLSIKGQQKFDGNPL